MKVGLYALLAFAVAILSGCGEEDRRDTVLVMAAASLTDAFGQIEAAFESANPSIDVQINIAGSAALREQILEGAPADVFASANEATMAAVIEAGAAESATSFASNELVIAVPLDNPGDVRSVEDLAKGELLIGICSAGVPCGDFARQALQQAGVAAAIDTNEKDVRSLLTKIELGELDAGIVYRTDVNAGEVASVDLPEDVHVAITYPLAVLTEAGNPAAAEEFATYVLGSEGQAILQDHGFTAP